MITTNGIFAQPIETPDTIRASSPVEHGERREEQPLDEHEPAYRSDLRSLVAIASVRVKAARSEEMDALDAPLNVEEAVRLAEGLLPPVPPVAQRRRLRVAALPLLALASAGVVVQGSQLVRDAATRPVTTAPLIALDEAVAAPVAATCVAVAAPESPDDPEPSERPSAPASALQPSPARSQSAATSRPHTAAVRASTTTPAPSVSTALEPPSLMQAITDAVRLGHSPADRR